MSDILQKYDLPSREELEKEFGALEEDDLLDEVVSKLLSKTDKFTSFLQDMLHPDSSIVPMQESSMFSNEERQELFDLFRDITWFQRQSLLIALSTDESKKASYFKEFYTYYISIKPDLEKHIKQAIEVWKVKEVSKANILGYFG